MSLYPRAVLVSMSGGMGRAGFGTREYSRSFLGSDNVPTNNPLVFNKSLHFFRIRIL